MRSRSTPGTPRFLLLISLALASLGSPSRAHPDDRCAGCLADFAVYHPREQADGVWDLEADEIRRILDLFGWTSREVDYRDINLGRLGSGPGRRFRALVMPGGRSLPRTASIDPGGQAAIEAFVRSGGSYLGFCAGSYYASRSESWAAGASGDAGRHHLPEDYRLTEGLGRADLLPGLAQGPFGWAPFGDGSVAQGWETVELNPSNPVLRAIGMPRYTKLMYYGGPWFELRRKPEGLEVWARAVKPAGVPERAASGAGRPTIIRFRKGHGTVLLFSYHPFVLLDGRLGGLRLQRPLPLPVLRSDPSPFAPEQVSYSSWNLLHAAFRVATGREPAPLEVERLRLKVGRSGR